MAFKNEINRLLAVPFLSYHYQTLIWRWSIWSEIASENALTARACASWRKEISLPRLSYEKAKLRWRIKLFLTPPRCHPCPLRRLSTPQKPSSGSANRIAVIPYRVAQHTKAVGYPHSTMVLQTATPTISFIPYSSPSPPPIVLTRLNHCVSDKLKQLCPAKNGRHFEFFLLFSPKPPFHLR